MADSGAIKTGSKKKRIGVIVGVSFIILALILIIYGLIGTSVKLQNVCEIEDIMKESETRTWRTVYFDITDEPILVGSDFDVRYYLLHGDGNYHIARMTEDEFEYVSNEVRRYGKMHFTGVTWNLGMSDVREEIAEFCDDMFHVGVTADNLQMYVGDVYIKYAELDYESVLIEIYSVNLVFGFLFLIIGCIILCLSCRTKKKKVYKTSVESKPYSYIYKGKWSWDAAAMEYKRICGLSEDTELTEEECYKIYDYTMTPISYFFGWLCERDLIGDGFANEYGEEDALDIINHVKTGLTTPLEVLVEIGCIFSYEWIKDEAKLFFRTYYDSGNIFSDSDTYLYDYYECNGEPEDRYYCMEYSGEIQRKINQRLDERYAKSNEKNTAYYDSVDYYHDEPDDENIITVYSDFFDKDIEVYRLGRRIKGEFPEDYALKCLDCFSHMSQKELNRMNRWLTEFYDVNLEQLRFHFSPYELYIYEPQEEGDVAFIISGGADFEEEHGISFTIRNGIFLDWSYAGESKEPYDEEMIAKYERFTSGIDFESLVSKEALDNLVSDGKLIRTKLLPECLGGDDTDSNMGYVTREAFDKLQLIHRRLKMLKAYAASDLPEWEFHVDVYLSYYEELNVLLPMWITFSTPWRKQAISISLRVDIWE